MCGSSLRGDLRKKERRGLDEKGEKDRISVSVSTVYAGSTFHLYITADIRGICGTQEIYGMGEGRETLVLLQKRGKTKGLADFRRKEIFFVQKEILEIYRTT